VTPASTPVTNSTPEPGDKGTGGNKIQHIVVIIQENRSMDNMFRGFPGADTVSSGKTSTGAKVALQPLSLTSKKDIQHSHINFERQYANGNLYFDLGAPGDPTLPYSYVPLSESKPYWDMASQYVLADRMFQSNNGPSYPAHLYLVGGGSQMQDENPQENIGGIPMTNAWGCDEPPTTRVKVLGSDGKDHDGPFPCFDEPTLADELDNAGVSWRYYAAQVGGSNFGAVWSPFDAIKHIRYGNDWNNVISPEQRVLSDASNLPSVTWVAPSIGDSDHSGSGYKDGPSWVSSVVNAIGHSPAWNSTVILITWDDWGGWYDHVAPPQIEPMGLGFRVPLIVVSPYAKHGYVSHVQYEFGSIMRFIEDRYDLARLTNVDTRANPLDDCFDFSQAPRPFITIQSRKTASYFLNERTSAQLPDND